VNERIRKGHQPEEATAQEVKAPKPASPPAELGLHDAGWTGDQWRDLLEKLVKGGVTAWKDIAALVLGHLNPSQVGTSLASSEGFKRKYGKGSTMKVVMEWVYAQVGKCADCGSRLELQADHVKGREEFKDPLDADFIDNMTLRCRRCNVVRRPSHKFGGLTYLTAEAALMWILLVIRPRTFCDYVRMCRIYGMTMSDIRMEEAWAMAHWLAREKPPAYGIEDDVRGRYDLLLWSDSAITRSDVRPNVPTGAQRIYGAVPGCDILGFLTLQDDRRLKFHEQPLAFLPFSTYDLDGRAPQSLAVHYTPPDRRRGLPQKITGLAPRNMRLLAHGIRKVDQLFMLVGTGPSGAAVKEQLDGAPTYGRLLRVPVQAETCSLRLD
jgi:hypothetical protein